MRGTLTPFFFPISALGTGDVEPMPDSSLHFGSRSLSARVPGLRVPTDQVQPLTTDQSRRQRHKKSKGGETRKELISGRPTRARLASQKPSLKCCKHFWVSVRRRQDRGQWVHTAGCEGQVRHRLAVSHIGSCWLRSWFPFWAWDACLR